MTDTSWRISGGIGVPGEPSQKMTQGLGYPLRPVDKVPPPNSGEFFENIPVAEGAFMQWAGVWQQGLIYPEGSVVTDDNWLMIANKATVDKAAPIPAGDPTWGLSDTPAWTDQANTSVIYTGHLYEFTAPGWAKALRVWAPTLTGSTNYRIIIVDITDPNQPLYQTIEEPVLNLDDWTIIQSFDVLVTDGTKLLVYLDALNSGADTPLTGGWTYAGSDQSLGPGVGGWNHDNQQVTLRINKTDLDSTDRGTELLGAIPGSTFQFVETLDPNYSVAYRTTQDPVDNGTYVTYNEVLLTDTGPAGVPRVGNTTTLDGQVPIPLPTDYVELAAGVPTPTWATVTGYKAYDGVDQGGGANGYGVDLLFEEATISPDWDFMSVPGV